MQFTTQNKHACTADMYLPRHISSLQATHSSAGGVMQQLLRKQTLCK